MPKAILTLLAMTSLTIFTNCGSFRASKEGLSSLASIDYDKACLDDSVLKPVYSGARQLSRAEIRNSVRDLIGVENNLDTQLPPEARQGYYFNEATATKVSYIFLEQILEATEPLVNAAFENPTSRAQILICSVKDESCARQIIEKLAFKAFHKNVSTAEISELMKVYTSAASQGFEEALKLAISAVLSSAHFLYITTNPKSSDTNAAKDLDNFELASRLSYFLWSSIPDDELINLAKQGTLHQNLETQVRRMIKSPKFSSFSKEFGENWLELEALSAANPDLEMFPNYSDDLENEMLTETRMLLTEVMNNDANPLDIVSADYTFINENLANHYGIENVVGNQFRKVDISGTPRRGILGHASILTMTSYSKSTSIIRRGKYIMDRLICSSPPPPPVSIELAPPVPGEAPKSQRERLEIHRSNPACFACHSVMDPMGFLLESFDATGKWRTMADGIPVDTRADFPNGKQFFNQVQFAEDLSSNIPFKQCFTKELMTFALGYQLKGLDVCHARKVASLQMGPNKKFSDLVIAIVKSVVFQKEGEQK